MTKDLNGTMQSTPYVVSCDLVSILEKWSKEKGYKLPSQSFFSVLRDAMLKELSELFENVQMLSEDGLIEGINSLLDTDELPKITLDQVYSRVGSSLQMCRAVDQFGCDVGITSRVPELTPEMQIEAIAQEVVGDVAVVDDVIFSGSFLLDHVIPLLHSKGIFVRKVFAAVGISGGVELLKAEGVEVLCLHTYSEVVDEICERDFYPGVPFSGRSVNAFPGMGMPYIEPFGRAEKWASIPIEHVHQFSQFCIRQTISLFQEIEYCSNKVVRYSDLARPVYGIDPHSVDASFPEILSKYLLKEFV